MEAGHPGASRAVRVVLVDEQRIMREGLSALLSSRDRFEVIGSAGDGRDGLKLCLDHRPDLVVFNDTMPGMGGFEMARRVAARCAATRMLCLSESGDRSSVRAAFDAGAHGYVLKRCAFDHLIEGIDSVLAARYHVSPELAHVLVEAFCRGGRGDESVLTPREREVLQLYAEGYSTRKIAERLHISMKTVGTHREHIQSKLGIEGIAELTRYALRAGIATMQ
ncbi:response regulator transcription factor [Luteibacter sp. PPL201]|jgi:DNA-binding NarL/FixJ family response regulator|uniref:Response regulator transcription factor n=1 Tax=Luteibacter sahnii TaxID=3021977 RepID=A0ABT6B5L5_9GAMM|nr:response regulator transcription factor [Luteibacter sp. PPL193]MDY1548648.1 response regulator transcription factor [Luteibacter sp. PPL193]